MAETADPILAGLLLATLDEPFEGWFSVTRLALADLLDERGMPGAHLLRSMRMEEVRQRAAELAASRHYHSTGRGAAYTLCLARLDLYPTERADAERHYRLIALRPFHGMALPRACTACGGTGRRWPGSCRSCQGCGTTIVRLSPDT